MLRKPFYNVFHALLFLLTLYSSGSLYAQAVTITSSSTTVTGLTNSSGGSTTTINFQNSNPYPIIITNLSGVSGTSGNMNASLWYKPGAITAAPGLISAVNGWQLAAAGTFANTANTTTTNAVPVLSNINLVVPPNTTYGLAVYLDGQRTCFPALAATLTGGGCTVTMSPTTSYGSGIPNSSQTTSLSYNWIGTITFIKGVNGMNNAGITQLSSPTGNTCAGTYPVKVKVNNAGNNLINNVTVQWLLNGVAQTPYALSQPLDTFGGSGVNEREVTLGNYTFASNTPVAIKAWTTLPNGVADTVPGNDTINKVIKTGLSGIYTVNSAAATGGTNYASFTALANDLNTYGLCGPVTVNAVAGSGPYTEYISFKNFPGSSATNTVRINGNGVTVKYLNTANQRQLLTLEGTQYTRIDSITFQSIATDYCWGALLYGNALNDSITRCTFDLSSIVTTTFANSSGILLNGAPLSLSVGGTNGTNCYIADNYIKGGTGTGGMYAGFYIFGNNNNNIIRNNRIENFYNTGISLTDGINNIVENNDIHRATKTGMSSFTGISCGGSTTTTGSLIVRNNKIHSPYGGTAANTNSFTGITNSADGTSANPALFYNNMIYDVNQGGTIYGLFINSAQYSRYYHNTVDFSKPLTGTGQVYGMYIAGPDTQLYVHNNMVSITSGTQGTKYGFYYFNGVSVTDAQKNNIYVNSNQSGLQYYGYLNTPYTTQAAFQAVYPALENGSPIADPQYVNVAANNFTPANPNVTNAGLNLTSNVPVDIFGTTRTIMPTIGAIEVLPTQTNNGALTHLLTKTSLFCAGNQNLYLRLANTGTNTITSATLNWQLNGVNQAPLNYTGNMVAPTSTSGQCFDTITLSNVPVTGPSTIKVWLTQVNGAADNNHNNDTIQLSLSPTTFVVASAKDSICSGTLAYLALTPNIGYPAGGLQWESSLNGTTWTPLSSTDTTRYASSALSTNTWFRARIINGGTGCYSNSKLINVNTNTLTAADTSRCGPGSVTFNTSTTSGNVVKWYTAATGGTPVAIGNSFTTPSLSVTTPYYIASESANLMDTSVGRQSTTSTSSSGTNESGLVFDALQSFILSSVNVYAIVNPAGPGTVTVSLKDASGTVLQSGTFPVNATYPNGTLATLPLNFTVPAGTGLRLTLSASTGIAGLARETIAANINFPYTLNGVCTINSSFSGTSILTTQYLHFFNWKIKNGCSGARQQVNAIIKPKPTVTLGNDTAICPGNSITLNATATPATGLSYQWSTGATTNNITTNTPNTYWVKVTNNVSCSATDTLVLSNAPIPTNILAADYALCTGGNVVLNAGNPGNTYLWNTGSTSQSITVTTPGNYTVKVTNAGGCNTICNTHVTQYPLPLKSLGADQVICSWDTAILNAGNPGCTYNWNTGNTTQIITTPDSGTYWVKVTSTVGCVQYDTVHIAYATIPPNDGFNFIPQINIQPGQVLFEPINPLAGLSYTWNFGDGTPEITQNSPVHIYASNGNYVVKMTSFNGCLYHDTTLTINVDLLTGIKRVHGLEATIDIYPNPAQDILNIEIRDKDIKMNGIAVYNSIGQTVFQQTMLNTTKQQISLGNLSAGSYIIHIITPNGITYRRFNIIR